MEFEFLSRLATEPTRVYTKQELLREVRRFKAIGNTARSTPTPAGCARSWDVPARRT